MIIWNDSESLKILNRPTRRFFVTDSVRVGDLVAVLVLSLVVLLQLLELQRGRRAHGLAHLAGEPTADLEEPRFAFGLVHVVGVLDPLVLGLGLMTDASYFREWTCPSWMYFPCAWGECGESGALQYVGRRNTACDWCLTNGDRYGWSERD